MPPIEKVFRGTRAHDDGTMEEVVAEVDAPEYGVLGQSSRTWFCRVRCDAIFGHERKAAGANPEQARQMAEFLVDDLLNHHGFRRTA